MATSGFLSSRIVRVALAVAVVVVVLGGVQASRVHHSTGELRLTPSQAPPKLQEFGRYYLRSSSTPKLTLPKDSQEIGETPGGGELFGPRHLALHGAPDGQVVATVLWVRDDAERVWTYGLSGGP